MRIFDILHEGTAGRRTTRIAAVGSCRLHDPFERLAAQGKAVHVWANNNSAIHTLGEARQIFDYTRGKLDIPAPFSPFIFATPAPPARLPVGNRILSSVDTFFVEASEIGQVKHSPYYFQLNHFWTEFVSKYGAAILPWYREFSRGLAVSQETIESALAKMSQAGREERALAEEIMRHTVLERLDTTLAAEAIGDIVLDPNKQWIFVSHFVIPGLAGTQMKERAELSAVLKEAAHRRHVGFFDPSVIIATLGREASLDKNGQDVYHYAPAVFETVAETLLRVASLPEPGFGGSSPAGEKSPASAATAWVNEFLIDLHRPRLKELGTDASGLYSHYETLLERKLIADRLVAELATLVASILPRFGSYHVLRAGLGEIAFILARLGLTTTAYDPDRYRFDAIQAALAALAKGEPDMSRRLSAARAGIPSEIAEPDDTLAIATHLIGYQPAQELDALAQLSKYRGLLIEPRIFLRPRNIPEEQDAIVAELQGRGFSLVQEYPSMGLVYLAKP